MPAIEQLANVLSVGSPNGIVGLDPADVAPLVIEELPVLYEGNRLAIPAENRFGQSRTSGNEAAHPRWTASVNGC
jgi:hypothetical protein